MKWFVPVMAVAVLVAGSIGSRPLPGDDQRSDQDSGDRPTAGAAIGPADLGSASTVDEAPGDERTEDQDDLLAMVDQPLRWHTSYETALALAERSGKPIFVRFR